MLDEMRILIPVSAMRERQSAFGVDLDCVDRGPECQKSVAAVPEPGKEPGGAAAWAVRREAPCITGTAGRNSEGG